MLSWMRCVGCRNLNAAADAGAGAGGVAVGGQGQPLPAQLLPGAGAAGLEGAGCLLQGAYGPGVKSWQVLSCMLCHTLQLH